MAADPWAIRRLPAEAGRCVVNCGTPARRRSYLQWARLADRRPQDCAFLRRIASRSSCMPNKATGPRALTHVLSALADEAKARKLAYSRRSGPWGCRFRVHMRRHLGRARDRERQCGLSQYGSSRHRRRRQASCRGSVVPPTISVRLICPLQAMAGAGKIATEEGYALVAFLSAGAFLVLRGR